MKKKATLLVTAFIKLLVLNISIGLFLILTWYITSGIGSYQQAYISLFCWILLPNLIFFFTHKYKKVTIIISCFLLIFVTIIIAILYFMFKFSILKWEPGYIPWPEELVFIIPVLFIPQVIGSLGIYLVSFLKGKLFSKNVRE